MKINVFVLVLNLYYYYLLSLFKSANGLQLCSVIIFQMTFSLLHLSKLP